MINSNVIGCWQVGIYCENESNYRNRNIKFLKSNLAIRNIYSPDVNSSSEGSKTQEMFTKFIKILSVQAGCCCCSKDIARCVKCIQIACKQPAKKVVLSRMQILRTFTFVPLVFVVISSVAVKDR